MTNGDKVSIDAQYEDGTPCKVNFTALNQGQIGVFQLAVSESKLLKAIQSLSLGQIITQLL